MKTNLDGEHIWVSVTQINDKIISGTLANDPINHKYVYGDPIKFELNKVEDWVYSRDGKDIGYYSVALVRDAQTKTQKSKPSALIRLFRKLLF